MRQIARWLLKGLTATIPVVIAACYGSPYRYEKTGKVVDADTHAPIPGIKVSCVRNDGTTPWTDTTNVEGSFFIPEFEPCAVLTAEDVDGAANGSYQNAELVSKADSETVTFLLQKKP